MKFKECHTENTAIDQKETNASSLTKELTLYQSI